MSSSTPEPQQLKCLRCSSMMEFLGTRDYRHIEPNFGGDSFFVYRCPACGKVEFFEFIVEDIECLDCGTIIKPGQEACPNCGWTWKTSDSSA